MINLQNVSVSLSGQAILHHINMQISDHALTILVGPNGCGKSTLLRTVKGLLPYQDGEIRLSKRPLSEYSSKEIARI